MFIFSGLTALAFAALLAGLKGLVLGILGALLGRLFIPSARS